MKFAILASGLNPVLEQSLTHIMREHNDVLLAFFSSEGAQQDLLIDSQAYLISPLEQLEPASFDLLIAFETMPEALITSASKCNLLCLNLSSENKTPLIHGFNTQLLENKASWLEQQHEYYLADGVQVNIIKLLALLDQQFGLSLVQCCVLQSLSALPGGVEALAGQTARLLNGLSLEEQPYAQQLAFNVLPGATKQDEPLALDTISAQEGALCLAISKTLGDDFIFNASFITVPVFYGDTIELSIELDKAVDVSELKKHLMEQGYDFPDAAGNLMTPASHAGDLEAVGIARLRQKADHKEFVSMTLVVDNVRNGAALNIFETVNFLIKHVL